MYRTYVLYILVSILSLGSIQAQKNKSREHNRPTREQIIQRKQNFLVRELDLSSEQANKIMPILNELDEKRFQLWQTTFATGKRVHEEESKLTDAELIEFAEQKLKNRVKEAQLEQTYYLRCRSHLSAKQFVKLEPSCHRFAREFFHHRHKEK